MTWRFHFPLRNYDFKTLLMNFHQYYLLEEEGDWGGMDM